MSRSESSESAFVVASAPIVSSRGLDVGLVVEGGRTASDGLLLLVDLIWTCGGVCSDLALDVSEGRSEEEELPLWPGTLEGEVAPDET